MECPFTEVGCRVSNIVTALSYHKHLSDNVELHLEMVMRLHQRNLGYCDSAQESSPSVQVPLTSALDKLNGINQEIEYLDDVLQQYEMSPIPSLRCIKTLLALPDVWLRNVGDTCSFRMPNYSLNKSRKSKWLSPPFLVHDGYKMRVCVYANGIDSGTSSHTSVALLLFSDEQLPRVSISLPLKTHIKVELLRDDLDFEADEVGSEPMFTWTPEKSEEAAVNAMSTPQKKVGCFPSPNNDESVATSDTNSASRPKSEEAEITLVMSEKFAPSYVAELYAQAYNSLVFRVTLDSQ